MLFLDSIACRYRARLTLHVVDASAAGQCCTRPPIIYSPRATHPKPHDILHATHPRFHRVGVAFAPIFFFRADHASSQSRRPPSTVP